MAGTKALTRVYDAPGVGKIHRKRTNSDAPVENSLAGQAKPDPLTQKSGNLVMLAGALVTRAI
jgi:hypothetical protein